MFHTRSTLIEDINFIVSRIVRLNSKLGNLRREHHEDRGSLPSDKTSVIRCTKCEGYGHENYQCPNWNGKYMTLQELQDYIVYLKEVKRSVGQKLEVRQEQQAKRDHEKAERTLKEIWEKARQERELKERKEEELREQEKKKQRERKELEMREREQKMKELKEREDKEQRAKEEEEQREKHENKSLLTLLTCMVEMKSLKGDDNALNCCSHSHHDFAFSLGTLTNPSLFVLMPREDLYLKEQWHKQWGEQKMIKRATTTWATNEPDFNHLLVCLSYSENLKGFQGHSFSIMITIGCFPLCFTVNSIVVLKLFDVFCRFIFDPGGQSPSTLIIRD